MKIIHYGSSNFGDKKFNKIKNSGWVKPVGGLWTSPIDSCWGWKDWCKVEKFRKCYEHDSFILELNEDSKVLKINSFIDLQLIWNKNSRIDLIEGRLLDFEKLSRKYDAIWLTEKGQIKTRFSTPNLYGWDCETVLVMNKNCFKEIKK